MAKSEAVPDQSVLIVESSTVLGRFHDGWASYEDLVLQFGHGDSLAAGAWSEIQSSIHAFLSHARNADPFDLIEFMRVAVFPNNLETYKETEDLGSATALELAALLLRDSTKGSNVEQLDSRVVVQRLLVLAERILELVGIALRPNRHEDTSVAQRLADSVFTRDRTLRGNQFLHIERDHLLRFLGTAEIETNCRFLTGVNVHDALKIVEAGDALRVSKFRLAQDSAIGLEENENRLTLSEKARLFHLSEALSGHPGRIAQFTVEEMSAHVKIDPKTTRSALELLSVELGSIPATDVPRMIAEGDDPMRGRAFVRRGEEYLTVNPVAATDRLRWIFESKLKSKPMMWAKYSKHRGRIAEEIALEQLTIALDSPPRARNLKYLSGRKNERFVVSGLGPTLSPDLREFDVAEVDGLFVFDSVAIIVEVKAGALADQSRRGSASRLLVDLKKTLGDGAAQARRLEQLAAENGGIWRADGTWLGLQNVTEVHKIVISGEEFGVSAIDVDSLASLGLIEDDSLPWFVSLHDLTVIAEICDYAAGFMTYLRRRTAPHVARRFIAIDELDLFMLFLNGGYAARPDPRVMHTRNPRELKPTAALIREFESQPVARVTSQTDDLAAWFYYQSGQRLTPLKKPRLLVDPRIESLVEFLQDGHKPGWLEFGADLLDVADEGQRALGKGIEEMLRLSIEDSRPHSVSFAMASYWGSAFLGLTTPGRFEAHEKALDDLELFVTLKKQQLGSSRALGVMLNELGEILAVQYFADRWQPDAKAELLAGYFRFKPQHATRAPPSARRKSRRLRK